MSKLKKMLKHYYILKAWYAIMSLFKINKKSYLQSINSLEKNIADTLNKSMRGKEGEKLREGTEQLMNLSFCEHSSLLLFLLLRVRELLLYGELQTFLCLLHHSKTLGLDSGMEQNVWLRFWELESWWTKYINKA